MRTGPRRKDGVTRSARRNNVESFTLTKNLSPRLYDGVHRATRKKHHSKTTASPPPLTTQNAQTLQHSHPRKTSPVALDSSPLRLWRCFLPHLPRKFPQQSPRLHCLIVYFRTALSGQPPLPEIPDFPSLLNIFTRQFLR